MIYLNDLLGIFSGDTFVSAYADDLAIACSNKSKEQAQIDMQREVHGLGERLEQGVEAHLGSGKVSNHLVHHRHA